MSLTSKLAGIVLSTFAFGSGYGNSKPETTLVNCYSTQEGILCAHEQQQQSLCTGQCSFATEKEGLECRLDTPSVMPRVELAQEGKRRFIYPADSSHDDWKKPQELSGLITCTDYFLWGKYLPKETSVNIKFALQGIQPAPPPPTPPPSPPSCARPEECTVDFVSETGGYGISCTTTVKHNVKPKGKWVGPLAMMDGKKVKPVQVTFTAPLGGGKEEVCATTTPIPVELGKTATYPACFTCAEQSLEAVISLTLNPEKRNVVYHDGENLIALVKTWLLHADGRREEYQNTTCSLTTQAVTRDGREIRPRQEYQKRQRNKRWEIPLAFVPRTQLTYQGRAGSLYKIVARCDDNRQRYHFPPYKTMVLVERTTPLENKPPRCDVVDGSRTYEQFTNGKSDESLGLKVLDRTLQNKFFRESTVIIDEGDTISLKLPQLCADPDNDLIKYHAESPADSPRHLRYRVSTSGTNLIISFDPKEKDDYTLSSEEPDTLQITVRDYNESGEREILHPENPDPVMTLKIKVNPVNDPPHEKALAPFQKRPIFSPTIFPFSYSCQEFFDDNDNHDNDDALNDQLACREEVFCGGTKLSPEKYQVEVARNGRRNLTIYEGKCEGSVLLDQALQKPSFKPQARLTITASDGKSSTSLGRDLFLSSPAHLRGRGFNGYIAIWGDSERGRESGCQDYLYLSPSESLLKSISSLFQDGSPAEHYLLEFKTDGDNFTLTRGFSHEMVLYDLLGGLRASVPTGQRIKEYNVCLTFSVTKENKEKK